MAKSAQDLIKELKEGILPTFWISRNEDTPWVDKTTIVTKSQHSEIIDLLLQLLKDQKVIKVKEGKRIGIRATGFCKAEEESDLSVSFYEELQSKSKENDIIVYAIDEKYAGMSILTSFARPNAWTIYVGLLCSIKPGTGTKILTMIKDAIKIQGKKGSISLSPLATAVGFYTKLGFKPSQMTWYSSKEGGKRTIRVKHFKSKNKTHKNI